MNDQTASRWEQHRLWIEGALVLLAALLAVYRTAERDFWFHLAAGRSIAENGIPSIEPWCLAAYGQWPWLGEWIFHLGLYGVYSLGGDWGIALWRAGWTALAMTFALGIARQIGAGIGVTALVSPVVLAVSRTRFLARPEQLTLAFVLLFLFVFEWSRRNSRNLAPWLILPQIVWASVHPMWVVGPLIAAGYAIFEVLPGRTRNGRRALQWGVLAVVLFASAGISPRPLDTWTFRIVRDAASDPAVGTIEELKSWSVDEELFGQYTGLLLLAGAALILGGAYLWRTAPALTVTAFGALAAGFAIFRFRALAAFIALSVLGAALTSRAPPTESETRGTRGKRRRGPREPSTGGRAGRFPVPVGVVLGVLAAIGGTYWLAYDARIFEPGVQPYYHSVPVRAVEVADSLGLEGPVLNTPWYGGYILWTRGEPHLPLQDARFLGSAEFRSRVYRARFQPAAFDTLLREWEFTHAILTPPMDPNDHLGGYLFHRPEWALIFSDDAGQLYVRKDQAPDAAERLGYELLSPEYSDLGTLAAQASRDSVLEAAFVAELERARRSSRWNSRAHLWLGLVALGKGEAEEALEHFAEVERIAPITPGLAFRQGVAHEMLGDREEARAAYRRALEDTTDTAAARAALERLDR